MDFGWSLRGLAVGGFGGGGRGGGCGVLGHPVSQALSYVKILLPFYMLLIFLNVFSELVSFFAF